MELVIGIYTQLIKINKKQISYRLNSQLYSKSKRSSDVRQTLHLQSIYIHIHTYTVSLWLLIHLGTWYTISKWMSCHRVTVMITGRAHCFHDYIYISYVRLSTLCVVDHLWPLTTLSLSLSLYIYIYIFIVFVKAIILH